MSAESSDPTSIIDFEKAGGLVTAIAQDDETGEVLMVAYMNEESLRRSLELGEVVYWSRSRKKYWHKGEESGNVQKLKGLYEAPSDREGAPVIVLDGAERLDASLDRLARGLLAVSAGSRHFLFDIVVRLYA